MLHVDNVEADYSCKETDIGFGYGGAVIERPFRGREVFFDSVEGRE
jgi:hypothetical protein